MPIPANALDKSNYLRLLLMGFPKCGKAQPTDEPVLTPTGWREIGSLRVGDLVIGSDGAPTKVVGVFPQGVKPVVRVIADDGASTRCCTEHLWLTTTRRELRAGRYHPPRLKGGARNAPRPHIPTRRVGQGTVKSAALIAETLDAFHYLPALRAPVRFAPLDSNGPPLDPYYLGLLLGDGGFTNTQPRWTKKDPKLRSMFVVEVERCGDRAVISDELSYEVKGGRTKAALEGLGLYGHKSVEKFIPQRYLRASPADRLALLRGLCDTDGHASLHKNGRGSSQCEYSTMSSRLAEDVVELARGLGGRAYVRDKEAYVGPKSEGHYVGPAWSVMISFNDGTNPFRCSTKADAWLGVEDRQRLWRPRIKEIEDAGEAECVCIAVSSGDHLYVTRGHLLTHNTASAVGTSPRPVYVMNCEGDDALLYARELYPDFEFDRIKGWNSMQQALTDAKKLATDGKIKTVVVDPLSDFAAHLEAEMLAMTDTGNGPDGRRAYPEYNRRIGHVLERLFMLPCNVIVITHYIETGGEIDGQTAKTGEGIVPLLAGKARALVAAKFNDVVWMEMRRGQGRIFVTGPEGRWGPGCRNIDGTKILPADINQLLKAFRNRGKDLKSPGDAETAAKNGVSPDAAKRTVAAPAPVRRVVTR
jgi:hypothetical protein